MLVCEIERIEILEEEVGLAPTGDNSTSVRVNINESPMIGDDICIDEREGNEG